MSVHTRLFALAFACSQFKTDSRLSALLDRPASQGTIDKANKAFDKFSQRHTTAAQSSHSARRGNTTATVRQRSPSSSPVRKRTNRAFQRAVNSHSSRSSSSSSHTLASTSSPPLSRKRKRGADSTSASSSSSKRRKSNSSVLVRSSNVSPRPKDTPYQKHVKKYSESLYTDLKNVHRLEKNCFQKKYESDLELIDTVHNREWHFFAILIYTDETEKLDNRVKALTNRKNDLDKTQKFTRRSLRNRDGWIRPYVEWSPHKDFLG